MSSHHIGSPDDAQAAAEAQQARRQIEIDVARHQFVRLLDDLDQDQLTALQLTLEYVQRHPAPGAAAAYYGGFVAATMQARFGVCQACGKNHEQELLGAGGEHA